ncbi:MAG TPA: hypothetical protein VK117_14925 [Pyrinomonadaceae bacterium]|nr:hypothetical protein [Pyrinomonadaceae bacterium]
MKRIFTILMAMTILAVVAVPSFAQGRSRRRSYDSQSCNSRNYDSRSYDSRSYDSRSYDSRSYDSRSYDSQGYYDNSRAYYDYGTQSRGSSVWDRHRDKLSVGAGTVGGAILGSLIGGRRGAAIGALAGAGGSALYTYKLRKRGYRY